MPSNSDSSIEDWLEVVRLVLSNEGHLNARKLAERTDSVPKKVAVASYATTYLAHQRSGAGSSVR